MRNQKISLLAEGCVLMCFAEDRFLMRCFLEEMMSVKDMLDRHRHTGLVPEHVNVPLIVSKLKWQHALHMRIEVSV